MSVGSDGGNGRENQFSIRMLFREERRGDKTFHKKQRHSSRKRGFEIRPGDVSSISMSHRRTSLGLDVARRIN